MNKVPCYKCLVFIMCKHKFNTQIYSHNSVVGFAHSSNCPMAKDFVEGATQEDINNMRKIFGLEIYK